MVDINLFEDEEEQLGKKEKAGDASGKKEGGLSGDSLKEDDFNFDEEPVESTLDPFDEPGVRPEFEENPSRAQSSKGGGKIPKVSPILIGLGVLVVAVAVYVQFFMSPKKTKTVTKQPTARVAIPVSRDTTKPAPGGPTPGPTTTPQGPVGGISSQTAQYVDVTKTILENLGRDKQFVVLLLKGDQFFVEYGSPAKGTSEIIGKKIQKMIGADGFTASREERKKVQEETMYFGVISGKLPTLQPPTLKVQKTGVDPFIEQLKTLMNQKGLSNTRIRKFSQYSINSKLQTPVTLRAEGTGKNAAAFLEALKSLQGNYELLTLIVVPQDITDLQANLVKMVVEFAVQ
jgi:hypothetical protein